MSFDHGQPASSFSMPENSTARRTWNSTRPASSRERGLPPQIAHKSRSAQAGISASVWRWMLLKLANA